MDDCVYVALAREADADILLTTEREFAAPCEGEPFEDANPVPTDVLAVFLAGS